MTAILRLQLDDKDPVRVNSAINQLAEYIDRNPIPAPSAARTLLTANTTFYVATTGSDANTGTSGSPFLTIQHAYNIISNTLDTAGFTTTIQCASGTYTAGLSINTSWAGGGTIILDLGGGTINTSSNCISVLIPLPSGFTIQNGTVTCSSAGAICIRHEGSGTIDIKSGMTFGVAGGGSGIHMEVQGVGAKINCFQNYSITGGAGFHYFGALSGNVIKGGSNTVTITGTPTITYFAYCSRLACLDIEACTFSGGTTGTRYYIDGNGVIFTNGGGVNFFPGTSPGTPFTGGQYL